MYTRVARLCIQRASRATLFNNTYRTSTLICQPKKKLFQTRYYATEHEQAEQVEEVLVEAPSAYPARTSDDRPKIYDGIAQAPFPPEISKILMAPIDPKDVEIKPDGLIYLPEIRYRRILNRAFGPGAWALLPISPPIVERTNLIRTYALYCMGRFVSEATGEQPFFEGVGSTATAAEAAKSNALVRCCKDLGIGSELWDPQYIFEWKKKYSVEVQCDNMKSKERRRLWRRADRPPFEWPWKEIRSFIPASQPKMPLETGLDTLGLQLALEGDASAPPDAEEQVAQQTLAQTQPQSQRPPYQQQQHQQQQYQQHYQQQQHQPQQQHQQHARAPRTQQAQHTPQQAQQQTQHAPQQPPQPPQQPPQTPPPSQKGHKTQQTEKAAATPVTPPAPSPTPAAPPTEKKGKKAAPQQAPAAEEGTAQLAWDLDAKVHPQYKAWANKTWRDMLQPKGLKYLTWASGNFSGVAQQDAVGFLTYVESRGGPQAILSE